MNQNIDPIEQVGIVLAARGEDVSVAIQGSGCSACHKSLCMLGDSKAKEIHVRVHGHEYQVGDHVVVSINPSSGYMAVATLYLIPFLFMIVTLWLTTFLGFTEPVAGMASLVILIPYFGGVFLLRGKLHHQCKIGIKKNEPYNNLHGH